MGWIFGIFGNYSENLLKQCKSIHLKPLHTFLSEKKYIAIGGLSESCFAFSTSTDAEGWVVSGVGITLKDDHAYLMNSCDWKAELSQRKFNPFKLNGHFAIAKWNKNSIHCYTDPLGLRNIYLVKTENYLAFSTRLDWITQFQKSPSINWEEFGSHWLLINQLSDKCILENVLRLNQGGKAQCTITPISIVIKNQPWQHTSAPELPNRDVFSTLEEFTTCALRNNHKLSLALSGGLDSRLLLGALMKNQHKNWSLHSFNKPDHPDRQIARQITEAIGLKHLFLDQTIPSTDKCITLMQEYIANTMLTAPASGFLDLQFYSLLHQQGKVVIDGAWGEIARRRFFNMVLLRRKKALMNKRSHEIIPFLKLHRATIFNHQCMEIMESGIHKQMDFLWQTMPSIKKIGIENWLDLLAIRTRLPNSAGPEQSRSDSEIINYMPFVQPTFVRKIFETSLKERRSGNIFRKAIRNYEPALTRFPLAKDGIIYPYIFTTIPASVWTKLKRKFGYIYDDLPNVYFLRSLSEYVQDIAHSSAVKTFEYYDHPRILELVDGFYTKGDDTFASELDWWLAFETWRNIIYT